ncbi:MAG: folate family ECF transporter S component [Caldisericia bacterium]|nr:folate family ECF transporter S component [Caldisericia bacterium]
MFKTKTITILALLTALSIVLTRLLSIRISIGGVEGIRIGFGDYPIILTGIIFGPILGGIVGIISDIVGYFISPMGPYMPHFTFTSALKGIIPGLLSFYLFINKKKLINIIFIFAITKLITSTIIIYFINLLFKLPLYVLIPPRIISLLIEVPVYTIITYPLLLQLKNIFNISTEN